MFKKKIVSLALAGIMMLSLSAPAMAVDASGSTGNTPVEVTADAAVFSVTLPTSIAFHIDANADVTCPSNLSIINHSAAAPISVTDIKVQDGNWTVADYNNGDRSKLAAEKVDSNQLGLSLQPDGGNWVGTYANGTQTLAVNEKEWTVSSNDGVLDFSADAIATAVRGEITNAIHAMSVVFTVDWMSGVTGYKIYTLDDVMDEDGVVTIYVGDKVQLQAMELYSTTTPVWSSSNPSIVGIDSNGLATGVAAGSATVTYTCRDMSDSVLFKVLKRDQAAPSAPTMASRTTTSITLNAISGCEYSKDGTTWQSSTTFSGLSSGITYTFYARKKATDTYNASPASAGASIKTGSVASFSWNSGYTYAKTLQFEEGMTWGEWCKSSYNTVGWYIGSTSSHSNVLLCKRNGNDTHRIYYGYRSGPIQDYLGPNVTIRTNGTYYNAYAS